MKVVFLRNLHNRLVYTLFPVLGLFILKNSCFLRLFDISVLSIQLKKRDQSFNCFLARSWNSVTLGCFVDILSAKEHPNLVRMDSGKFSHRVDSNVCLTDGRKTSSSLELLKHWLKLLQITL